MSFSNVAPSRQLFQPKFGALLPFDAPANRPSPASSALIDEIETVLSQKNYPCVAALRSFFRDDYLIGLYEQFGTGRSGATLRNDLLCFLDAQQRTQSPYLTLWAIFPNDPSTNETLFESAMWNELSHLTSNDKKAHDWKDAPSNAIQPESREFSFRINGHPLFVVGLHPRSSRKGRRFPWNALIFNSFAQFEKLEDIGAYEPMVATNRKRDEKFQGAPNPMTLAYGDRWEAIQFSGKENPSTWKCPFRFIDDTELHNPEKKSA